MINDPFSRKNISQLSFFGFSLLGENIIINYEKKTPAAASHILNSCIFQRKQITLLNPKPTNKSEVIFSFF